MELSTVARLLVAFYRLTGSETDDEMLTEHGEAADDVAYQFLTRGARAGQRWMLDCGLDAWHRRTSALTFTGSDDADGGRKVALPADFLRTYGGRERSALTEANGTRWGQQIEPRESHIRGNVYYIRGGDGLAVPGELWLGRGASPPATLYLEHYYMHPTFTAAVTVDFPLEARALIVAEAANEAKEENWLPAGRDMETKIMRNLLEQRNKARKLCRQTKSPRQMAPARRKGNNW